MSWLSPISMMWPRYITAMRFEMCLTMLEVVCDKQVGDAGVAPEFS